MTMSELPPGAALNYVPAPAHGTLDDVERLARTQRSRRVLMIKWLRQVHGWIGLWGAALGLLFGITGVMLNHRAGPLRIPTGEPIVSQLQLPVPQPAPRTSAQMAQWLRTELNLQGPSGRVRCEPAQRVAWGDRTARQPEHWTLMFNRTGESVVADYWVGNSYVSVKRSEQSFLATLANLHRGVGMSLGWVLLVDTIAGGMFLLALTGVILWTELHRRRLVGVLLVTGSIVTMVCCAWW